MLVAKLKRGCDATVTFGAALGIAPRFGGAYFELANCLFAPLQTAAIAGEPLDDAAAAAAEFAASTASLVSIPLP